jgi:hypothetical protein
MTFGEILVSRPVTRMHRPLESYERPRTDFEAMNRVDGIHSLFAN